MRGRKRAKKARLHELDMRWACRRAAAWYARMHGDDEGASANERAADAIMVQRMALAASLRRRLATAYAA